MNVRLGSCAAAAAVVCLATAAVAQPAPAPGAGRLVITGAVRWRPSSSLGESTATLTPGTGQDPYRLFSAAGTLNAHAGAEAGLGYVVSPSLRLALNGEVAWPVVGVRVDVDAEGVPAFDFDGESLVQWSIGGRAEYDVRAWRFAKGRAVPFLTAGFGLFWQSHEGGVGIESGHTMDAGAGLTYVVRRNPSSRVSRVAVVADCRVSRVTGGISWNGSPRMVPSVGVGVATAWGRARKAS